MKRKREKKECKSIVRLFRLFPFPFSSPKAEAKIQEDRDQKERNHEKRGRHAEGVRRKFTPDSITDACVLFGGMYFFFPFASALFIVTDVISSFSYYPSVSFLFVCTKYYSLARPHKAFLFELYFAFFILLLACPCRLARGCHVAKWEAQNKMRAIMSVLLFCPFFLYGGAAGVGGKVESQSV